MTTTRPLICMVAWLAVWIAGCVVFDALLQLDGSWLMLGGAVTYAIANGLTEGIAK